MSDLAVFGYVAIIAAGFMALLVLNYMILEHKDRWLDWMKREWEWHAIRKER